MRMNVLSNRFQQPPRAEYGFTLTEVLIVISVVLLLTLIAIPNFSGMRIQANENSAVQSLRAIYQAEVQFQTRYPASGFACSLPALGGASTASSSSATQTWMLPSDLASGHKSGYTYAIINCTKVTLNNQDQYTSYDAVAIPQTPGKTGHRGFCIDQQGEIKADPAGGSICTQNLQ